MTPESKKLFNRIPYKWIWRLLWIGVILGILTFGSLLVYVGQTKMPDTQELENPKFDESTIIYSSDGVELDRYFQSNRQWIKYEDISTNVVHALMATEDYRFFDHSGIDARGTARAFAYLGQRGGASTITQQLAKQFFTEKRSSFFPKRVWQKMKEWVIAIEFERRYTKEEIMAMFLNKFEFTFQAYGIAAAAQIYFGKDQKELTIPEASVLIGMLKNPYYFNPVRFPERSMNRRNTVLSQLNKYGFITQEEHDVYRAEEIDISRFNEGQNYKGPAPHFMSVLKKRVRNIFDENQITKPGGEPFNLDTDGLKIFTTIDSRYQKHANAAAKVHMRNLQEKFFNSWGDRDIWSYIERDKDITDDQVEKQKRIRDQHITRLIEQSESYRTLRFRYLDGVIKEIKTEIPEARLYAGDIRRLITAEQKGAYLDGLIKSEYITKNQKKTYEKILTSSKFSKLKIQWGKLKDATKSHFNTPRKMQVYSYDGPKEVTMTPIDSIKYMQSFLQIGAVSMDPSTGEIKAWVGGSDYDIWKYDHVTTERQVGSTFKPFLYTAALNSALSPCMKMRDVQQTVSAGSQFGLMKDWNPKNTRGKFTGEWMTLKEGLKKSNNSTSVWILNEIGSVRPVIDVATNMGLPKENIPKQPSIILGSAALSVLDMTRAYSTFANDGVTSTPILINRIEYQGTVIYEEKPRSRRTLNENVNYAMVRLLKHASGFINHNFTSDTGGKTGTSNDHVDGWFMGLTPHLVTGTWVGGSQNWVRFLDISDGQGGRMARPFYVEYMKALEADSSIDIDKDRRFKVPIDVTITTDCEAYENPATDQEEELDEFDELGQ